MSTRKHFITAIASVPLIAAAPPSPMPSATASPAQKRKVSDFARAFAERMRAFDPRLTPGQLHDIARGIDDNVGAGERANPKGRALKNWDEPVTTFQVPE